MSIINAVGQLLRAKGGVDPDTGLEWRIASTPETAQQRYLAYDKSESEWVSYGFSISGAFYRSGDGGATWDAGQSSPIAGVQDMKYVNPSVGVIATGRTSTLASILRSVGGGNFTQVFSTAHGGGAGGVSIATDGVTVFVGLSLGSGASIIVQSTNGTTWTTVASGLNSFLARAAAFNGSRIGFRSVSDQVAYSDNGGASWSVTTSTFPDWPGFTFNNHLEGGNGVFLAGNEASIHRSTDFLTWTGVDTSTARGLAYSPELDRWVCSTGSIRYSDDGGLTWATAPNPTVGTQGFAGYGNGLFMATPSPLSGGHAIWVSP